jgi:hypothetical protein
MFVSFSLKQIIQQKLEQCLNIKHQENFKPNFQLTSIPLEISSSKFEVQIIYKSPLCLLLASIQGQPAKAIAQQFIDLYSTLKTTETNSNLDLQVSISGEGWLEFSFGERFLTTWLQQLPHREFPQHSPPPSRANFPFHLYYTHARCCSLLRGAHRDKLIKLHSLDFQQPHWQWQAPQPIPFNCLSWQLQQEKKLLRQLMIIVDELSAQTESPWLKLATNFSEVILDFERNCRIWGEIKGQNCQLAQARLGLIALSQYYFRWILEQKLGVFPPVDL